MHPGCRMGVISVFSTDATPIECFTRITLIATSVRGNNGSEGGKCRNS